METLRVERVACRFARKVAISLWHEAPEDVQDLVGLTIDVLDPSWEVFDGSALASATLAVWAYCLVVGGLVRAVSWAEDLRAFVEDAALRRGMRVEARFAVEHQETRIDACSDGTCGGDGGGAENIYATATIVIDALVLETVVLPVVTAIEAGNSCPAAPNVDVTEPDPATGASGGARAHSRDEGAGQGRSVARAGLSVPVAALREAATALMCCLGVRLPGARRARRGLRREHGDEVEGP